MSRYDATDHITHRELAETMGIKPITLSATMRRHGSPTVLGTICIKSGQSIRFYGRGEAMAWMQDRQSKQVPKLRLEKVPPRQAVPVHEQGEYRPSDTLSANFARAAEVYSHSLITPQGRGNAREFAYGHDRARLSP